MLRRARDSRKPNQSARRGDGAAVHSTDPLREPRLLLRRHALPRTDLNLTSVNSASVNGIVGDWGDNGLAGRATWTCWFGGTQGCTASLNRHYTDYYVSNKKRTVWLHELGHCFGLNHSSYATAVMRSCPACAYEAGQTGLHSDDKNGMNSLY